MASNFSPRELRRMAAKVRKRFRRLTRRSPGFVMGQGVVTGMVSGLTNGWLYSRWQPKPDRAMWRRLQRRQARSQR